MIGAIVIGVAAGIVEEFKQILSAYVENKYAKKEPAKV